MGDSKNLTPFVYWAQDEAKVFLKVDLLAVEDHRTRLSTDQMDFSCLATGAQGRNEYAFHLNLYDKVKADDSNSKITDKSVAIALDKQKRGWWPRLTSQPKKPHWLKIDFDRWKSPDDMEEEEERVGEILRDRSDVFERLQKEEIGYRKEDSRIVYLTCYNFFMYLGFLYVCVVLLMKFLGEGSDFFPKAFDAVGKTIVVLEVIQTLEILHPIVGIMKGGPVMPFMQISGRIFILFMLNKVDEGVQREPAVFFMFLAWSAIEIIRYPYYISQLFKNNNKLLTWIRYNAWIVLYPAGWISEVLVCYKNIPYLDRTHKWSLEMPNSLNVIFNSAFLIRFYILFMTTPGIIMLIMHMHRMRRRKFGTKSKLK